MKQAPRPLRFDVAKPAYTTALVDLSVARQLLTEVTPAAGDLVLAEVVAVGHHRCLELASGRRASLFPGDEIIVCYGARYATDQFHAVVPDSLEPCHLAAAGGLAGLVVERHGSTRVPTEIRPIGLLADAVGRRMNLRDWRLPAPRHAPRIPVVAVLGTSMNSGKTTTAAHLVRGLAASGLRAAAAKVTGTGAGGDRWLYRDAGATPALDFTLAGLATTYGASAEEIGDTFVLLRDVAAAAGAETLVVEIADGLAQRETAAFLRSECLRDVAAVVFAAGDALGALAGVRHLLDIGLPVRAVSGLLTASPLATVEAAGMIPLPVLGLEELADAEIADRLLKDSRQAALAA